MSCEAFPRSGAPAAAGSCSPGGAGDHPAFYSRLLAGVLSAWAWAKPSSVSVLFHRPPDQPGPSLLLPKTRGGSGLGSEGTRGAAPAGSLLLLPAIGPWLGGARPRSPGEEGRALPLRDSRPWSRSLLGKVWGKAWLGALEPRSWYGLARKAACYPRALDTQTSDRWTCHHPASSPRQEKPGFSIWPPSDLSLSTAQRMGKPAERSQPVTADQDHGYYSLEMDHILPEEQQLNAGNNGCPRSECAMAHCSEADDMKEQKDYSVENEESVLLHLVDVDLTTCNLLEIEDKIISLGVDEWDSSGDESEDDSEEEEFNLSISRPQCSNKAIAYILGSPGSDEDDDSEDDESAWDSDGFDSDESSDLSDSNVDLWNPLAEFSDPYNPLNFRASIKTRHMLETGTVFEPSKPQQSVTCFPVIEDFEDRLDSGFSDVILDEPLKPQVELPLQRKCSKRVAFDEHVTEYYVSSEEIRKGPWEKYALDRYRFQKRIKEAEELIGYCFTLKHRWSVLQRMQLGN